MFSATGALKAPEAVACTLSNGESTKCYQFVYTALPDGISTGPFCPKTVNDAGGVWAWDGNQSGLYVLNKAFWDLTSSLGYHFTNDDGKVNIEDPSQARPPSNSTQTYASNNCLERGVDASIEITAQIPLVPVNLATPTQLGTVAYVGLALDGLGIFADAPSVQDTGNLPALDYCGGHFDPSGYYHWHEVATDADTVLTDGGLTVRCGLHQSSSELFGYAYDGYPIYGSTDANGVKPEGLDACNGHSGPTTEYPDGVYHYHAATKAHSTPPCLVGATSTEAFRTNASFGAGSSAAPTEGLAVRGRRRLAAAHRRSEIWGTECASLMDAVVTR